MSQDIHLPDSYGRGNFLSLIMNYLVENCNNESRSTYVGLFVYIFGYEFAHEFLSDQAIHHQPKSKLTINKHLSHLVNLGLVDPFIIPLLQNENSSRHIANDFSIEITTEWKNAINRLKNNDQGGSNSDGGIDKNFSRDRDYFNNNNNNNGGNEGNEEEPSYGIKEVLSHPLFLSMEEKDFEDYLSLLLGR